MGSEAFRKQVIDTDATVITRPDEAGAVLVAKLATGELARRDRGFGGRTNNRISIRPVFNQRHPDL